MRIALLTSEKDNAPKVGEIPWEALAKALVSHTRTECDPCAGHHCPKKRGRAWSPAEYDEGATRGNANVKAVHALVLDLDGPTRDQMGAFAKAADGFRYVVHSTHAPGNYRAVFALSRPVTNFEWPRFWARAVEFLHAPADQARKDLAGLYFFPTCPKSAVPVATQGEGVPLDVDYLLASAGDPNAKARPIDLGSAGSDPTPDPLRAGGPLPGAGQGPIDLEPIRAALKRQRKAESVELARKLLRGEPLAMPSQGAYGGRDGAVNAAASLLATCPDDLISVDAAMAFLEPCVRVMECAPEGVDFWLEKARNSFERAHKRRSDNDGRTKRLESEVLEVLGLDPAKSTASEEWRKNLLYHVNKDGAITGLEEWSANADLIFSHDQRWKGTVKFNEVTKALDIFGGPLSTVAPGCFDTEAGNWLQRSEYRFHLPRPVVGDQLLAIGRRHSYDPIAEYLRGLRWDNQARANNFFQRYFGSQDLPEYLNRIGPAWLISCVARALNPGCKVDTVLILEGPQGKKKSTALRSLAGDQAWFSDTKLDIGNKDSRMIAACKWIVEIQELASFRRRDSEELKAFFSQRHDDMRLPYGRVMEAFPRRCIFVGTTNSDEYLSDETGHRRYWRVRIPGEIDIGALEKDRDQIWAEAVAMFNAGHKWWLEGEAAQQAEKIAGEAAQSMPQAEVIWRWWTALDIGKRPEALTIQDVAVEALHTPVERITHAARWAIGRAMKELGFLKRRERRGDALVWVYQPSETLRAAKYQTRGQDAAELVGGAKATQPEAKA
jgi:hypothetical protein